MPRGIGRDVHKRPKLQSVLNAHSNIKLQPPVTQLERCNTSIAIPKDDGGHSACVVFPRSSTRGSCLLHLCAILYSTAMTQSETSYLQLPQHQRPRRKDTLTNEKDRK